jgi:hypothetical protein
LAASDVNEPNTIKPDTAKLEESGIALAIQRPPGRH